MDFTLKKYQQLLDTLQSAGCRFLPVKDYTPQQAGKYIILRHDVDLLPGNSLAFARIQAARGIRATYYFRMVPESFDETIIKEIAALGHEIGYHYEDLTSTNGDIDKAYESFCRNLEQLRKLVAVGTICMHGSPRSPYDSKDIWKKYDYKTLGIYIEPYFDLDFDKLFYLTDTGRRWDGWKVSVRDKVPQQEKWQNAGLVFHATDDIIKAVSVGKLSSQILFTFHPQRWTNAPLPWLKELFWQGVKNVGKRLLIRCPG